MVNANFVNKQILKLKKRLTVCLDGQDEKNLKKIYIRKTFQIMLREIKKTHLIFFLQRLEVARCFMFKFCSTNNVIHLL